MQSNVRQLVASHLKDSRPGVLKYLGAETDNALNELVDLLVPSLQQAADEAAVQAVEDQLKEVDRSPEALVHRLLLARANRPEPVMRKRVRRSKQAAPEVTSAGDEPASSTTEDTVEDGTQTDWNS